MSKNISIQEGGIARLLSVAKLKTNLSDSGTCLWVPEDEVQLTTKTITSNGTYNARDDGFYGYEQVIVSVAGGSGGSPGGPGSSVEGTDGDGDESMTTVTPEGELETKKVPSAIEITTPPTKTTYTSGQTIDYNGMVVKMKLKTGGVFTDSSHADGVLKKSELTLPMTTVSGSDSDYWDVVPIVDIGDVTLRVGSYGALSSDAGWTHFYSAPFFTVFDNGSHLVTKIGASSRQGDTFTFDGNDDPKYAGQGPQTYPLDFTYEEAGYTVYYNFSATQWTSTPTSLSPLSEGAITSLGRIAWNMVYGSRIAGTVNVPVRWTSTYDGRVFQDTFPITVVTTNSEMDN